MVRGGDAGYSKDKKPDHHYVYTVITNINGSEMLQADFCMKSKSF